MVDSRNAGLYVGRLIDKKLSFNQIFVIFMMEKFITKKRKSSDGDHDEEAVNLGSTIKKKGRKKLAFTVIVI